MAREYQVLYPSPTTEKEILATVIIEDATTRKDAIEIRRAIREAATLSLAAQGITNVVPGARTIEIEAPRRFDERDTIIADEH
jgi:hypothetical protein